jgi:hypothetical protein
MAAEYPLVRTVEPTEVLLPSNEPPSTVVVHVHHYHVPAQPAPPTSQGDAWAIAILGGIFTVVAAIVGPIALEVYKENSSRTSNSPASTYRGEYRSTSPSYQPAPPPPQYQNQYFDRRYSPPPPPPPRYCAISPNGNRVCCVGRRPVFDSWRVRMPNGFVRNEWRLYCP